MGETEKAAPKWSFWDVFPFYLFKKRYLGFQKHGRVGGLFEVLKMFYPTEGSAKADPKCPVEKSFHHIGLGNGTGVIKNTSSERNFWNLENVSYDRMGWDGMGRSIKSVIQFSLYFVFI